MVRASWSQRVSPDPFQGHTDRAAPQLGQGDIGLPWRLSGPPSGGVPVRAKFRIRFRAGRGLGLGTWLDLSGIRSRVRAVWSAEYPMPRWEQARLSAVKALSLSSEYNLYFVDVAAEDFHLRCVC